MTELLAPIHFPSDATDDFIFRSIKEDVLKHHLSITQYPNAEVVDASARYEMESKRLSKYILLLVAHDESAKVEEQVIVVFEFDHYADDSRVRNTKYKVKVVPLPE